MSGTTHLEYMSDVLHAVATHQGRVEYAGQIAGKVGCSEEQVQIYVSALRDAGYVSGQLIGTGSTHSSRRRMDSGIQLTLSGFEHVDQHRSRIKHTYLSSTVGEG